MPRVRRPLRPGLLFLVTALSAPAVFAQPAQPSGDEAARLEEARNQYRAGVQAFQRNRFGDAVVAFERSFHARPHPATLYNAAEARMRAGDNEGALGQLRDLLAMTEPAPDAELVTRARTLAQQMGERDLRPAEPRAVARPCPECPPCHQQVQECPPPPPPQRETSQVSPAAYGLAGASLVLVAVGAGFLGVAIDNASTYTNPLAPRELQDQMRDQGETYRIVGIAGLALGVGAAVGAVWMFTHPQRRTLMAPAARLDVGVSTQGLLLRGTF